MEMDDIVGRNLGRNFLWECARTDMVREARWVGAWRRDGWGSNLGFTTHQYHEFFLKYVYLLICDLEGDIKIGIKSRI